MRLIILMILFWHCQNAEEKKKRSELLMLATAQKNAPFAANVNTPLCKGGMACTAVYDPTPVVYNIKYIDIYYKNKYQYQSKSGAGYLSNSCGTFTIKLDPNDFASELYGYSDTEGYCMISVKNASGSIETFHQRYNGNLNTFTEITAGDYKFVPVR